MKTARSPLRNFAVLSAGQAVSAMAALVTNIWLARVLGPAGLGLLGFGTAIVAYLVLFTGLGSEMWSARMIAAKKYSTPIIIGRIFGMRIWAFCLVAVIFLALLPLLAPDPDHRRVLLVQATAVLVVPVALDYFYQGIERQTTTAVRQAGQALLSVMLILLLVRETIDVLAAAVAQMAGAIIPALLVLIITINRYPVPVPDMSIARAIKTFRRVAPFTVSALVTTIFMTVDIVMLGLLSDKTETGYYVAGFRLMLLAQIPAGLLFSIAYPKLASAGQGRRQGGLELFAVILVLVAVTGCVVALATAPTLIETVYGVSFLPAVPIIYVQMITVIVLHGIMAPASGLSSWGHQMDHARSSVLAAVINVALNLALIPKFGGLGAAVATLISQSVLFALFSQRLHRATGIAVFGRQVLCLSCGVAGFAAVYGLANVIGGIPLLISGTVVSALAVVSSARLLGLFRWSEVRSMIRPAAEDSSR